MTYEELKEGIKKQREDAGIAFLGNIYFEVPQYDMMLEALEKQIPRKPFQKSRVRNLDYSVGVCLSCRNGVNSDMLYCDICGQKLEWT